MWCTIPTLSSAVIWYMITLWLSQVTVVNLQMFKTNKFYYWEADNRNVYSVEIAIYPSRNFIIRFLNYPKLPLLQLY